MFRIRVVLALVAALGLMYAAGCGGSPATVPLPDYGSEDGLKIAQLVGELNDGTSEDKKFKRMFAGDAPANRLNYNNLAFEVVVGSPKVNGAAAAATVTIKKDATMETVGTQDWTFVKVGEAWKIKTAPLR